MNQRSCSFPGCEEPHDARGYCGMHYMRARRGKTPMDAPKFRPVGSCKAPTCDSPHHANGYCVIHHSRVVKTGDAREHEPIKRRGGDDITYEAAHIRVSARRGRASDHRCIACDVPATEWAFDWERCPEDRVQWAPRGIHAATVSPYSPDPEWYQPMDGFCHSAYDARMRATWAPWMERNANV